MAHVVPHYLQYAGKKSFKYILPSGPQFFFFPMPHCLTFGSLTDQGLFNSGGAPTWLKPTVLEKYRNAWPINAGYLQNGISPCCTWSHTPPACGWATVKQTPCWVAPMRTPSPWGCQGACRLRSPGGSAGAATRAAVEAWTPAPGGHIPLSADCTTTPGHDVMNKKHGSASVVSDTSPAEEREGEKGKVPKIWLLSSPKCSRDYQ